VADGVIFDGGEKGHFDTIIFATGYRPSYLDFLESSEIQGASASPTKIDPAMFFVGFRNPVIGLLREISEEAKKVSSDILQHRGAWEII
jgi:hypothetical protein